MKTIYYKYPVLTSLEQICCKLDGMGIHRFCTENGINDAVASAAYSRACEKRREIGLWAARERDGRPHYFTVDVK